MGNPGPSFVSVHTPLIPEDTGTVAHVYWDATGIKDTKGNVWTVNGTIPLTQEVASAGLPFGAGPFSVANFYSQTSTGVTSTVGSWTVLFTCTAAMSSNSVLISSATGTAHHTVQAGAAPLMGSHFATNAPTGQGNFLPLIGINIASAGSDGTVSCAVINGIPSTFGTLIGGGDPIIPAVIGKFGGGTLPHDTGQIFEMHATTAPATSLSIIALHKLVMAKYGMAS